MEKIFYYGIWEYNSCVSLFYEIEKPFGVSKYHLLCISKFITVWILKNTPIQ